MAFGEGKTMRTEVVRAEVQRLLHQVPFRPFALSMENGDRIVIEHPENIAFDPAADDSRASTDFYVISGRLRVFSTFEVATSVALVLRFRKGCRVRAIAFKTLPAGH
jgi:hypothetical protein